MMQWMMQFLTFQKSLLIIIGLLFIIAGAAKVYEDKSRHEQAVVDKYNQDVHDKWQRWIKK